LDLVAHTGGVHRWVERIVSEGLVERPEREPQLERDPARLFDWFGIGLDRLAATLRAVDPSRRVWTMADDRTADFWRRRMSHETTVHRWDAEDALGEAQPIDPPIAATGIPETLEIHVVRPLIGRAVQGRGERIGLHLTDLVGDWRVRLDWSRVVVEEGPGIVDANLDGTASAIWLALMGRAGPPPATGGDERVLESFSRALTLAEAPSF
jgi:uncharacterized protein (TIGR03083 family)